MAAPSAQKKILLVLTNHSELGNTGKKTGWYLPEAAHPYYVFKHAGYAVDFVTPLGGKAPVDPGSVEDFKDDESKAFLADPEIVKQLDNTHKADSVNPHDYAAIFYAGGHGPLWDIPENAALQKIARDIYEAKGVVGSVCHGPGGIANVKLSNGNYLIAGKKATGFTDAEEDIVQLSAVVPFSLEQVFKQRGAHFENAAPWQSHVTVDERLVTGQNPASAKGAGEAVVKLLRGGQKKILLVLTNHSELGNTGKKTGWYLPEAAHPYYVFKHAGYAVDFVTPLGGKAPVDPGSVENFKDDESKAFLADPEIVKQLDNTHKADSVNAHDYVAIFYAGGHGPLWDIPENAALQKIAREIYEAKGVVGSVCHGPAGIANVKLSNGNYLIAGKKATGFTDAEEDIVQLSAVVPFSLEQVFKQRGAHFENAAPWQSHVTVDERLVTGQNPASAKGAGEAVVKLLH